MRPTIFALALGLVATLPLAGCKKEDAAASAAKANINELSVDDVAKLVETGKTTVVDANNDETRSKYGVVPGAKLLSSSRDFDVSKELPADKSQKLVFYCGGEKCKAAEGAASKAALAGYSDVNVMRAGITGWAEAGKPVSKVN